MSDHIFMFVLITCIALHLIFAIRSASKAARLKGAFDGSMFLKMLYAQSRILKPKFIARENINEEYEVATSYSKLPMIMFFVILGVGFVIAN